MKKNEVAMKNGVMWKDICGNDIQAHGGCIIRYNDTWYWYGENKGQPNNPGERRVDVIGISCYSSKNLVEWKYEGLVLKADESDPESPLHPSKVVERPKVLHNEKTNKFVMWLHIDSADYSLMSAGVAVADCPTGPFELIDVLWPNGRDSQDMTLYKDENGQAYLFHTTDQDKTMSIDRLDDSYLKTTGEFVSTMIGQKREAPAVCKHKGLYYIISSGCTGWDPNSALYAASWDIMGEFVLIDNPCEGDNYRNTFNGQSTYVFEAGGKFWLMLDHWNPDDLQSSGYSILPVEFTDERMTISWRDEWKGI